MALSRCPQLFSSFFRIGIFTLGGGYAMLPLIQREVVENKRWLDNQEFVDSLAIAQSLPGPLAVNTSVFVGYKTAGVAGLLCAVSGVILPSFICMVAIAMFFANIRHNPVVEAVFKGIRPAVTALIAGSVWSLAKGSKLTLSTAALALAAALAVWLARVSPAWIVLGLAVAGLLLSYARQRPGAGGDGGSTDDVVEPSLDRELET